MTHENRSAPTEIRHKDDIVGKKVALYLNLASVSLFIELHAAIARDLLSRGNIVTAYLCDSSFKSPMDNPFNRWTLNSYRMFRGKDAIKGLGIPLKIISLRGVSSRVPETMASVLETGTMSSFASILKAQSKNELSPKWKRAYDNMFESAKKLYNYFVEELEKEGYEFVFMFNGRFGCTRPALEAAKHLGIGYGLYENHASVNEVVAINELTHSVQGNTRKALAFYKETGPELAAERAKDYFVNRALSKYAGDVNFTKAQDRGSVPDGVAETTKKVVAIYPSTEDEFKFIGREWDGKVVESQVDEIDKLASELPADAYLLVVKMHPNQVFTAENTIQKYQELAKKYPHVIVELPLSKKDTYALMRRADFVLTFASTVGIEASYARKPVILIGDSKWSNIEIGHKVYTARDAAQLIKNNIGPTPILGSVIWGNYLRAYKDHLPSLEIRGLGDYWVDGRRIGRSFIRKLLQLPAKFEVHVNSPGFHVNILFLKKIYFAIAQLAKRR